MSNVDFVDRALAKAKYEGEGKSYFQFGTKVRYNIHDGWFEECINARWTYIPGTEIELFHKTEYSKLKLLTRVYRIQQRLGGEWYEPSTEVYNSNAREFLQNRVKPRETDE